MSALSFFNGFVSGVVGASTSGAVQSEAGTSTAGKTAEVVNRVGVGQSHQVTGSLQGKGVTSLCSHNDRGDTSVRDVAEHVFDGDIGKASRDIAESRVGEAVADYVNDAFEGYGKEITKDVINDTYR